MPVDLSKIGIEAMESLSTRRQQEANSALLLANARAQELENDRTQRLESIDAEVGEILSTGKVPPGSGPMPETDGSRASALELAADRYMRAGAVEEAAKLADKASEIRKREHDIDRDEVSMQQNKLENIIKGSQVVGTFLGGARNAQEWEIGKQRVKRALDEGTFVMEPELFAQIEALPYNEDMPAFFADQAISAEQKARLQLQQAGQEQTQTYRAAMLANQDRNYNLEVQKFEENKRQHKAQEQNGGKNAPGVPSENDRKEAQNALLSTVFAGVKIDKTNKLALENASSWVADNAKRRLRDNPSITWNTALQQAIIEGESSGVLKTSEEDPWFGEPIVTPKVDVKADLGRTPNTAMPPPRLESGAIDTKKLVKGMYYVSPTGKVGKFDGTRMVPIE